jgi:hypothetical protein
MRAFGLLASMALVSCAITTPRGTRCELAWQTTHETHRDGSVTETSRPDRVVVSSGIGAASAWLTGNPWTVLAGGVTSLSEAGSKLLTVPARAVDNITTSTR